MAFQKGNKFGKGGAQAGAGRPPDWFKTACQDAVYNLDFVKLLSDIASGERIQQVINDNGEEIDVPAALRDRLKAMEMVLERAYGKAEQLLGVADVTNRPSKEQLDIALRSLGYSAEGTGVAEGK